MRRFGSWLRRWRDDAVVLRDFAAQPAAIREGRLLRLVGTLVVVAAVAVVDIERSDRITLIVMLLGNHVLATGIEYWGERDPRVKVPFLTSVLALFVVFSASFLAPQGRLIALFAYLLIIAYLASAGGRAFAVAASVLALAMVIGHESSLDDGERLGGLTMTAFGVTMLGLSLLVDGLTRARMRTADNLARLHAAMRTVTAAPDLAATLDSVVASANRAVGALETAILLVEDDHLVLAAPAAFAGDWPIDRVAEYTRRELASADQSPLAVTITRGETVALHDVAADERFPVWSKMFNSVMERYGVRSLVSTPLRVGTTVIGAIHAMFDGSRAVDDDTVQLLQAYAEQATLVIVRAQAYEKERQLTARLTEADRVKSEFLALVSHELRTPLTAAKGFVDTVVYQWDKLPDAKRLELLSRASANADELGRLISQLLDYSRMEGAGAALDPRPTSVAQAVRDVVTSVGPVLAAHQVVIDVPDDLAALLDAEAFGHALSNLLANAAKFSPPGSSVTVSAVAEDGEVLVAVSDDGPGIALDEQDLIFERFYQSPAHRGGRRGAGLGLSIARRYIEVLGGRVWVESEPGAGATFVCALVACAVPGDGLTAPGETVKLDQPV